MRSKGDKCGAEEGGILNNWIKTTTNENSIEVSVCSTYKSHRFCPFLTTDKTSTECKKR